jgi:hypothetical protein
MSSNPSSLLDPGAIGHQVVDALLPEDLQWVAARASTAAARKTALPSTQAAPSQQWTYEPSPHQPRERRGRGEAERSERGVEGGQGPSAAAPSQGPESRRRGCGR